MAINFLNDVGFNKNELIQPVLENQANDASAGTPVDGQLYYDTTNNVVKYGEGGSWVALSTGGGSVTSVGLSMPSAFSVANSPITGSGTLTVTGAGTTAQYVRGDGSLATFPTIPTVNNNTITLTMGNGLSSTSGSFTLNQNSDETFTFTVGAGTGIQVNSGNVQIDYAGIDNAILSAGAASPAGADILWFSDDTDDTIKKASITDILALAPQGDITGVSAGDGITVTNGSGPVPTVAVKYAGAADNLIQAAANQESQDILTTDVIIYSESAASDIVNRGLVSDLPFTNNAGTVTSIATTSPILGGTITSSGTISHASQSQTNTTPSSTLSFGGTFTALSANVGVNATGHVTGQTLTTFTMPANPNTNETYTLPVAAGGANSAAIELTAGGTGSGVKSTVTFNGTTNEVQVTESIGNNGSITIGLPDDVTIAGELTVSGTGQSSFGGQVTIPQTPVADTDAASKKYVDDLVSGGLTFKGTFRADSGLILSGTDSGSYLYNCPGGAGTRIAVTTGDYYVVATAGGSFYCSGSTLDIGDAIIAVNDAAADSSTASDWSLISQGVVVNSFTNSNGTYVSASTVNTNATGAVTVGTIDLSAVDGTSNTGTRFLSKDNTWDVPSYTTNTDANYALQANAKSGANVPLFLDGTNGGSDSTVNLTEGTGITLTRNSSSQITIDADNNGTVTSVGITDGYLIDSSGTNPITSSGSITLDVDASELVDMTGTILTSDEAFVLDVSEIGKDQGKRKAWSEIISDLNLTTGSHPTVNNATITLSAGEGLDGGGSFTLNQSGNATISFSGEDSSATNKGIVIVAPGEGIDVSYASGTATVSGEDSTASNKGIVIVSGGTGIDVSYLSGTATVSATSGSTGGFSGPLTSVTSGIARAEAGGITTFTLTTATLFGATTNSRQCIVEVMDGTTYATVYPEVARAAITTIEIKFKGSVANDAYDVSIVHAGSN
jgi:hypothetical protein